jgi:SAM-dependent methyltransferase
MDTIWKELHSNYKEQNWIEKPSIFAEMAIQYFPKEGKVLELGAGLGQDSFFFAKQGYDVISGDIEISSLTQNLSRQSEDLKEKITIKQLNLKHHLPFEDQSVDIVYAHLSLHYFDEETTWRIFNEIKRVLKPNGLLAFLVNSINDPEYHIGKLLEEDFFVVDRATKRYFSIESTKKFTQNFQVSLLDSLGQTYKDRAKGVSNLIRFIGINRKDKIIQ